MAAVTLQEVADRADVSLATASRVLNGSARTPGPDVAARVRHAAQALGYVANGPAQALARASTQLIGLVVHDIADPYFSSIAHGVQQAARQLGRAVLVADTGLDPVAEHDALLAFLAHRVDAVILAGSRWADGADNSLRAEVQRYVDQGGRVAMIGQQVGNAQAVVPQQREGAAALADALVVAGHQQFAILSGPAELITASDRTSGFVGALERHGIAPTRVIAGGFGRDGGYEAASHLIDTADLAAGTGSMCMFAVNDVMAIGAIAALRSAGIRVPDDVQVAGFDDIPTLRDFVPALTTVRLPLSDLGAQAVELVLGSASDGPVVTVPGEVVLRDSTQLPRQPA